MITAEREGIISLQLNFLENNVWMASITNKEKQRGKTAAYYK